MSKKYLPFMASSYSSPKLTLHVGDGREFVGKHRESFDVIITDSSDPVGTLLSLEMLHHVKYTNICYHIENTYLFI